MSWLAEWLAAHPAPPAQKGPWGAEISYSQVRAFLDCPWLHKLRYQDFMRGSLTPPASLGVSLHRALESFHRAQMSDGGASEQRLQTCFEEAWLSQGYASAQEQMEWHGKGLEILETYYKGEQASENKIIAVEREFLFPLGSHTVRGMIDRVDRRPDGSIEIIDYKTHTDFLTEDQARDDLQLLMYGLAAKEAMALEPAWLTLYYVGSQKKVTVPYDTGREDELQTFLSRVADMIAGTSERVPNTDYCERCDLRNRCSRSIAKDADCA
jgi:RecB family exonuclease